MVTSRAHISDFKMIKKLLVLDADVNGQASCYPLNIAIFAGYTLVELLLQHEAESNKTQSGSGTPPQSLQPN